MKEDQREESPMELQLTLFAVPDGIAVVSQDKGQLLQPQADPSVAQCPEWQDQRISGCSCAWQKLMGAKASMSSTNWEELHQNDVEQTHGRTWGGNNRE